VEKGKVMISRLGFNILHCCSQRKDPGVLEKENYVFCNYNLSYDLVMSSENCLSFQKCLL